MGQQIIGKGQHGVDVIQRGTAVSSVEEKVLLAPQNHLVKYAEVGRCGYTFDASQGIQLLLLQGQRQLLF